MLETIATSYRSNKSFVLFITFLTAALLALSVLAPNEGGVRHAGKIERPL